MSNGQPTGGARRPIDVGDTLGQYKLVELIAIGGMGLVYRAYDISLDRYVAVKVLAHELARDLEIARRFLNEARAAATLNHPNVVHVYSAGEQAGTFYFVMELVKGEHLEALLSQQRQLPVREAVEFIRQAALGLQHAHEHGIIHGDVKPANFLVSESGQVKVTDFGLARRVKAVRGRTDGESLFGTPGYISPETIQRQTPDHRSDIYSLGATLFHMLSGKPPFTAATPDATMRQHLEEPVPSVHKFNPKVSPALNQIVMRMLAKDPAARYQSYADLVQAFDRYLAERQLTGRRVLVKDAAPRPLGKSETLGAPPAAPKPPHRESLTSVIFTLLSVIGCIIILYILYRAHVTGKQAFPTLIVISNTVAPPLPAPVSDVEQQAKSALEPLKAAADAAFAAGQIGRAYASYATWSSAKYTGTTAHQIVEAERARLHEAARQQWLDAVRQIEAFCATNEFKEALAVCDRLASVCAGMADLSDSIAKAHSNIVVAERDYSAKKAAVELARSAQLEQWKSQFNDDIINFRWDKGQQEVQRLLAETADDAKLKDALSWLQIEMASLVALRKGVSDRLKVAPSAPLTLTTKRGELQVQVVGLDADSITLRQSFGDAGFAEITSAWSELTPASVCRLFVTCLDQSQPDELLGYAVLITHQALAKQARLEDARKTLQAIQQHEPSKAALVERYLKQLAALPQTE